LLLSLELSLADTLSGTIHSRLQVSLVRILKNRSLQLSSLSPVYPLELFPFYIYGTPSDAHIDHILTRAPNITLSASSVRLVLDSQPATGTKGSNTLSDEDPNFHATGISIGISPATIGASLPSGHTVTNGAPPPVPSDNLEAALASGAILTLSSHHERPLQPFPFSNDALPFPFFFRVGTEFAVKIWADPAHPSDSICGVLERVAKQEPLATGTMTLGEDVVVDVEKLNRDPWGEEKSFGVKVARWRKRFKTIANGGVV
jgi:hypothetical protein